MGGVLEKSIADNPEFAQHVPINLGKVETSKAQVQSKGNGSAGHVAGQCPDCGATLVYQEGCLTCHMCGYSKC
jgi:ribonucleoside-diphosphate reductase alpha chain